MAKPLEHGVRKHLSEELQLHQLNSAGKQKRRLSPILLLFAQPQHDLVASRLGNQRRCSLLQLPLHLQRNYTNQSKVTSGGRYPVLFFH